jgi:hypothetical protein
MPGQGNENNGQDSWLSKRIAKVTGVVLALTALVTASVHFRDSIPWLTPVAKIELMPDPVSLDVGDKIQMAAEVKDSEGKVLSKRVKWTSANPILVTVEGDGFVTAGQSAGSTTITATVGPVKGVTQVHVRRVNVAVVEVFPPAKTLQVDEHLKFDATPYDSEGNSLLGRPVRWSSENNAIASMDEESGEATGRSPGSVKMIAESEGKFDAATITVNPNPTREAAAESRPSAAAQPPQGSSTTSRSAPVRGAEVPARKDAVGAPAGVRSPASEAARSRIVERPPQAVSAAMRVSPSVLEAQKITIVGGLKTGVCPASVRILIGEKLIDLKSDPQEVFNVLSGDQSYTLHGTVACPRQVVAVVDGHGTANIANQKTYRCSWKKTGPKNFAVELMPE